MTAQDPRLGEIEALAEGLTELCPTYLRQIIRHVQRNCDIDCNEHDGDDACNQPDRYDGARMAESLCSIPYLLAELRKRDDADRSAGLTNRQMQLAALMAYDAVEEGALREAGAKALEDAAEEFDKRCKNVRNNTHVESGIYPDLVELADNHERTATLLRARAAAVRSGE